MSRVNVTSQGHTVINTLFWCSVNEGNKRCRALREQVIQESQYRPLNLLQLLMNTAKLELKLKEVSYVATPALAVDLYRLVNA